MSDLTTKKHPNGPGTGAGAKKPAGYAEIESQPGATAHNGHLQPKASGGSGTDLRNLVAEYSKVNTPYLRTGVEWDIKETLEAGKTVILSIIPHYDKQNSGIPSRLQYDYTVLETRVSKSCMIYNEPAGGRTTGTVNCPKM
ncbi:DNA/RNA non-specific endonuclease [Streptomyces sp. YIM 98790]|uniref:DNA/RNA non-specific endonuclease n=1 Tax=Streptomyces sp. YIM 98790 TaxID=2689077 RepID=UPI00140E8A0F|nr:DNA/RNA non-specific endonuclease [Streptomyces sp. YIM 98790]